MRVLVAPDSFKGTATAAAAAAAIARGWLSIRPDDDIVELPMADGGEGSADAIAASFPGSRRMRQTVTGPDGRPVAASWLLLPDATAVVELAAASGLPLMAELDALRAQTTGFGQLLAAAAVHPEVRRIVATVGGSASTDGAAGALSALGARLLDDAGRPLPPGGRALVGLHRVDHSRLVVPPAGGVEVLTDVTAPLLGPTGAAAVFGPQKGADAPAVAALDAGLARLAAVIGGDPDAPGSGAAGGSAFGLATLWAATLVPGAPRIAEIIGVPTAAACAEVLITGEGRFDEQSSTGKVVGHLLDVEGPGRRFLIAGSIAARLPERIDHAVDLSQLAGSARAAMADTTGWLVRAGADLAGDAHGMA